MQAPPPTSWVQDGSPVGAGRTSARRPRLLGVLACCLVGVLALPAPRAEAHGGRMKPPPPKPGDSGPPPSRPPPPVPPPPSPKPRPSPGPSPIPTPRPKPPPVTPGPGVPPGRKPLPPTTPSGPRPPSGPSTPRTGPGSGPAAPTPTTPDDLRPRTRPDPLGRGGRRRPASAPAADWQTWWALNRWSFFPERGTRWARPDAVVTPAGSSDDPVDREALDARRRALITRQQIVPFLLAQLDPKTRTRAEVRAASALALAKVHAEPETADLLLLHAEHEGAPQLVRESAALAVGLLRREKGENTLVGARLDEVRMRLLALLGNAQAATRTRAFAALSLGLLGDQPHGSSFTRHGRMVSQALWQTAQQKSCGRELTVAVLTALGMQPQAGVSEEVKTSLLRIANGRRIARRRWDDIERSHALTAMVRLQGPAWQPALLRTLRNKRLSRHVQRAAFLALCSRSGDLTSSERVDAANATLEALRSSPDPMTKGLGALALGHLQGADLQAGHVRVLERSDAGQYLRDEAHHGSLPRRGFAALALALSVRKAVATGTRVRAYGDEAIALLARGFERVSDPEVRAAYAVALGLIGPDAGEQVPALTAVLRDRAANAELRGHVAIALAAIAGGNLDVRHALRTALLDKRSIALRSQAALALSFLGGESEAPRLVAELQSARSQWVLAQVAAALGQLDDLRAVPGILAVARDEKREDEARALAIVSLGLLGDPARTPSMLRLTADANFVATCDALKEAFTIF